MFFCVHCKQYATSHTSVAPVESPGSSLASGGLSGSIEGARALHQSRASMHWWMLFVVRHPAEPSGRIASGLDRVVGPDERLPVRGPAEMAWHPQTLFGLVAARITPGNV